VNDAPVLDNSGTPYLTTINEDDTGNAGTLISDIIARGAGGDPITDVDSGDLEGIAVTAAVTTHGSWQYTTDGINWNPLGAVTDSSARVLFADDATKIRFVPNADWNGTEDPAITFRAWDQTGGFTNGQTGVDASMTGGTNPFSSASETALITANSVNDAPAANNHTVSTAEDTPYVFVASDFQFSDAADPGDTLQSVKITSLETAGALKYDGSDVTLNQEISVGDINTGKLTFEPALNANGTGYAGFGFQVSDGTDCSASSYTMTVDVNSVNDAPAANNHTVVTNEDTPYVFVAGDFQFSDAADPGDTLQSVKITSLETAGALKYDGSDVTLNQEISVVDINTGKLTFEPALNANGTGYAGFGFQVSDGTDYSASSYTMTVDVSSVNDAPAANNHTVVTNEDTPYVFVASDFQFSDTADPGDTLQWVKITSLETAGALKYVGSDVTLNQEISVVDINAGKLTFEPALNANGTGYAGFGFQVSDGTDCSASSYTMTVDVSSVNDAPVLDNTGDPLFTGITENDVGNNGNTVAEILATGASGNPVTDVDSVAVEGIAIYETEVDTGNGTWQYKVDSGPWTDIGTVTDSSALLLKDTDRVRFVPDGQNAAEGTISFYAWDQATGAAGNKVSVGARGGTTAFSDASEDASITVTAVNDAPLISGDTTGSVTEDASPNTVSGTLSVTDVDAGEDHFNVGAIVGSHGSLLIDGVGAWIYTLNNGDSAVQALPDGGLLTDTITVHTADGTAQDIVITINGVNDAAVIGGTSTGSVTEDLAPYTTTGTLTVADVDTGESLFTAGTLSGVHGSLVIDAAGSWAYILNNGDPAVQALAAGSTLTDTVTVSSADGTTHNVTITVTGVNDTAVIGGTSTGSVTEDLAPYTTTGTLTVADVDTGESLFTAGTVPGVHGSLVIDTAGAWTYTLNNSDPAVQALAAGSTLTDTVTVSSADGTTHNVTITVTGVNDAAVIGGTSTGSVTEDLAPYTTTGTLTVSDVDTGQSLFTAGTVPGVHGSLVIDTAGAWTYTLNNSDPVVQALAAGSTLTDTVTVSSVDGTTSDVTITVTGVNDTAVIGGTSTGSVTEDLAPYTTTGTLIVADVDTGQSLFTAGTLSGAHGSLVIDAAGFWTYTLNNSDPAVQALAAGSTLTDSITVSSVDGTTRDVTITVTGVNDAAVIGGTSTGSVTEDLEPYTTTGTLIVADVDTGQSLFTAGTLSGAHGSLVIDAAGAWTYTLNNTDPVVQALAAGSTLTDTVTVHTADGSGQNIVIIVNGVNDAPAGTDNTVTMLEDGTYVLSASDFGFADPVDNPANVLDSIKITQLETAGSLRLGGVDVTLGQVIIRADIDAGNLIFTPDADANGIGYSNFRFAVMDDGGTANGGVNIDPIPNTFSFNVTAVNDAPMAQADSYTVAENGVLNVAAAGVLTNDSDVDLNPLRAILESGPANGALTLNDDGSFTYSPALDFYGSDSFTYKANDGLADSNLVSVNIMVDGLPEITTVNTGPFVEDAGTVDLNAAVTVADADSSTLTLNLTASAGYDQLRVVGSGAASVNGNGSGVLTIQGSAADINATVASLTGHLAPDFNGNATIGASVSDGIGSANGTVLANVTAVNDAPVTMVPGVQTTPPGFPLTFSSANLNAVRIVDVDAGTGEFWVGLQATNGTVSLSQTTGLNITCGCGVNDALLTCRGTLSDIDAALQGMSFAPTAGFTGAASLKIMTYDFGNTGAGGPLFGADQTVTINVQPVVVPAVPVAGNFQATVNEDTVVTLYGWNFTDANGDQAQSILVTNLPGTGALFRDANANNQVDTGEAVVVNTEISWVDAVTAPKIKYLGYANFSGSDSLTYVVKDTTGQQGSTPAETGSVSINVAAVNDAPVATVPGTASTAPGVPLVFNSISVSDVDAGTGELWVGLQGTNGTVSLSQTTGLTITAGTGTNDTLMTFKGNLTDINAALQGMSFLPTGGFTGTASLKIMTYDFGNTGAGGPLYGVDQTVAISVQPVVVPAVPVAGNFQATVNEDTAVTLSGWNFTDANGDQAQSILVTNLPGGGTLFRDANANNQFDAGEAVVVNTEISWADAVTAANLKYLGNADFNGSDSLTYVVRDTTGQQGSTPAETGTVSINVAAVNDAPVATVPGAASTAPGVPLVFTSISVSDIDAGTNQLWIGLQATNGTVSLSQITGLTITYGTGVNDGLITFKGNLTDINAALQGLSFAPSAGFTGAASLKVMTYDFGNSGSGGALYGVDKIVNINVA
jgi:large repetitive protein